MTDSRDGGQDDAGPGPSTPDTDAVYEAMEPLEPYTTGEIASLVDGSKAAVRGLLEALVGDRTVRKKEPERGQTIWIREPPSNECPDCGRSFTVRFGHPIFQNVQYCPACGTQVRARSRR